MKNQILGWTLVVAAVLTPLIWFLPLAAQHDSSAVFSQFLGTAALIIMAITMLIATRWPGTALLFGPLDRAYVMHKWLAISAMTAILLHDTIDADIDGLGRETLLVDLGETLGEISLYALLALVLLSVATFTPYKRWKWTHRFIGAFFVAGAIHFLLILKPFDLQDPPSIYLSTFCIVGTVAYFYALLTGLFKRGKRYKVIAVDKDGDATVVTLQATKNPIKTAAAGQFAFLSFDSLPESHPFTISKVSEDGKLRFTIKALGDYTRAVQLSIEPGMYVGVKGPYGGFTREPGSPEIWIGAGVGITPFAAWANDLGEQSQVIHLFYSVKNRSNASHLAELESIAKSTGLHLHLHETSTHGRLTIDQITSRTGNELSHASVSFCGPVAMREKLKKEFSATGVNASRFHYEIFELRSGVGFRKVMRWLIKKFPIPVPNIGSSGS